MNLKQAVMDAWQIVTFKEHAIKKIAHEKDVLTHGILITVIAGIAAAIGTFSWFGIITFPIGYLIGSFIGLGILHLLALLFGGKGTFKRFFAVGLHTSLLGWVMVIPVLGFFLGAVAKIWGIVAMYFIIKNVHELSPGRSLAVLLIPIILALIVMAIIATILAVTFFSVFGGSYPWMSHMRFF